MNGRRFFLSGLLVVLAAIWLFGKAGTDDDHSVAHRVSTRYLVCGNCAAQYEIPADYFANVSPSDMDRHGKTVYFRCRECGELAAEPGMTIVMDGEVVGVSGVQYDERMGLDEK
jgi:hypothetical protein